MPGFPQGHALVIGVGKYAESHWNVPTATRDAEDLAGVLSSPDAASYEPRNVQLILDDQATLDGVTRSLDHLANRVTPESVVLISFTCHGALGADAYYYLATADTVFTPAGEVISKTGLSVAALGRALRAIPARRLLLVVNACFAGHLSPRLSAGGVTAEASSPVQGAMLPDEASSELAHSGEGGRAILAAGRPDQRSYFLDGEKHSFFGEALISALRGAAGWGAGGSIGLFELYEYVYRDVHGAARRRVGALQEPTMTLLQGVGPFPVASFKGQAGDERRISQARPAGAVRELPPININVTNKRSVISFDGATVMGDVRTGNVVEGDLTIIGGERAPLPEDEPEDPLRRLPLLRKRVEVARNVDEDARSDAAYQLSEAEKQLAKGEVERARQRIDKALLILRSMNNAYVNSVVRKLEALAAGL